MRSCFGHSILIRALMRSRYTLESQYWREQSSYAPNGSGWWWNTNELVCIPHDYFTTSSKEVPWNDHRTEWHLQHEFTHFHRNVFCDRERPYFGRNQVTPVHHKSNADWHQPRTWMHHMEQQGIYTRSFVRILIKRWQYSYLFDVLSGKRLYNKRKRKRKYVNEIGNDSHFTLKPSAHSTLF